jgi:ATP-dependent DNA helicase RecQ
MPSTAIQLLERHFGFDTFLPGQEQVIQAVLEGHSAAAVFPTGGGKSLCYQLPALALEGLTVVVSPLIALMKDQIDALTARGIRAQRLDSTLSGDEYRETLRALRAGELQLLYVAPERFNNERFRELINSLDVALFAVDEAHCISEWGHNFRPDYLKLARFAVECGAERVLALTATATDKVLADIRRVFEIAPAHAVRAPFYRPNLRLLLTPVASRERERVLETLMKNRPAGATIIYVTQQRTAEWLAGRLADAGLEARAYHAGLADDVREAAQNWFFEKPAAIVVATIAFGMGIDKPDIRYVYHYNLPKSLEGYAQEIGRAGRDGEPAICQMLVNLDDLNVLENFVYGDTPSDQAVDEFVREVDRLGRESGTGNYFDLSIHQLASQTDIRILVLRTLLTYLELDGQLEGGTPFYSEFQFQPQRSSAEILSERADDERTFLSQLFRQAKKGRTWFTIDVDQAARATGTQRSDVVRALDRLHDAGELEVRARGALQRYRRTEAWQEGDSFLAELSSSFYQRMLRREAAEIERLREVTGLVTYDGCQVEALSSRFGDPPFSEPCGHCSHCEAIVSCLEGDGRTSALPPRQAPEFPEGLFQRALELRAEFPEILAEPRALSRFLCATTSPRLTRAKLTRHELFGCMAEIPFPRVLERCRELTG